MSSNLEIKRINQKEIDEINFINLDGLTFTIFPDITMVNADEITPMRDYLRRLYPTLKIVHDSCVRGRYVDEDQKYAFTESSRPSSIDGHCYSEMCLEIDIRTRDDMAMLPVLLRQCLSMHMLICVRQTKQYSGALHEYPTADFWKVIALSQMHL